MVNPYTNNIRSHSFTGEMKMKLDRLKMSKKFRRSEKTGGGDDGSEKETT